MTKKIFTGIFMLLAMMVTIVSCSDNDETNSGVEQTVRVPYTLKVQIPAGWENATLTNVKATFVNQQTGVKLEVENFEERDGQYQRVINFIPGSYNVTFTADASYLTGTQRFNASVRYAQEGFIVRNGSTNNELLIIPELYNAQDGFVISEIYFTQTKTSTGGRYSTGAYFIITNNSNDTLYADSLALLQSADISSLKHDYTDKTPVQNNFFAGSIYTFPGKGKDYPVAPGKNLIVALDAKDHTKLAVGADLSKANFEIYDLLTGRIQDEDNPNVPNLDTWFKKYATISIVHTGGVEAFALARMRQSKEEFIANNFLDAKYMFKSGTFEREMSQKGYLVPTDWVIDAVCLGMKDQYEWSVIPSSLDAGFTYCLNALRDETAYGTAVIRRFENGKYVDTNNSTNDFLPRQKPSLFAN